MKSKWIILVTSGDTTRVVSLCPSISAARQFDSWIDASQWILKNAQQRFQYQIVELTHTINPAVVHDCCGNPVCRGHAAGCNEAPGN